jgi:ubiquinone biosynthesis accessory factor UbiK
MRPNSQLFEQLSQTINRLLPRELADDVRENVKGGIAGVLDRFDLVTREELEIQEAVLKRTREKLETLETQVAELEKRLAGQAADAGETRPDRPEPGSNPDR